MALRLSNFSVMRVKYSLAVKRPVVFSPQVQPMIPTPTHGSLPSGHATEAFFLARLLWKLLRASGTSQYNQDGTWGDMLMRQAARIAINRTVAGVHFPVDSVSGAVLGLTLADYFEERCTYKTGTNGTRSCATFTGENFAAADDFNWHQLYDPATDEQVGSQSSQHGTWMTSATASSSKTLTESAALQWLWDEAVKEWQDVNP